MTYLLFYTNIVDITCTLQPPLWINSINSSNFTQLFCKKQEEYCNQIYMGNPLFFHVNLQLFCSVGSDGCTGRQPDRLLASPILPVNLEMAERDLVAYTSRVLSVGSSCRHRYWWRHCTHWTGTYSRGYITPRWYHCQLSGPLQRPPALNHSTKSLHKTTPLNHSTKPFHIYIRQSIHQCYHTTPISSSRLDLWYSIVTTTPYHTRLDLWYSHNYTIPHTARFVV